MELHDLSMKDLELQARGGFIRFHWWWGESCTLCTPWWVWAAMTSKGFTWVGRRSSPSSSSHYPEGKGLRIGRDGGTEAANVGRGVVLGWWAQVRIMGELGPHLTFVKVGIGYAHYASLDVFFVTFPYDCTLMKNAYINANCCNGASLWVFCHCKTTRRRKSW